MTFREYVGDFRHRKLYRELRALIPNGNLSVSSEHFVWAKPDDEPVPGLLVGFPDSRDPAEVDAVVAAHDPSTPDATEVGEDAAAANAATLRERADQAVAALEQAYAAWPNLTAAQRMDAARLNVRVTVALARLQLRKLDST